MCWEDCQSLPLSELHQLHLAVLQEPGLAQRSLQGRISQAARGMLSEAHVAADWAAVMPPGTGGHPTAE